MERRGNFGRERRQLGADGKKLVQRLNANRAVDVDVDVDGGS